MPKTLQNLIGIPVLYMISTHPIRSLLGLALIPVQHRLPFEAAFDLVWIVSFGIMFRLFVPWLRSHPLMQPVLRKVIEAREAKRNGSLSGTRPLRGAVIVDEL